MKRSSILDFQSIGQSLKRVKISTSPGELRLDRDMELLLSQKRWTTSTPSNERPHELLRHDARLTRDPVDPLRIRLTFLSSPSSNPERWTFVLQLPRMYPHFPPVVTRTSREGPMVGSSVLLTQYGEAPVPERVVVRSLTPGMVEPEALWEIDAATAVYDVWSPVRSLGELLEFLMGIPSRRREWWSIESNRVRYLQRSMMGVRETGVCVRGCGVEENPCNMEEDSMMEEERRVNPFITNRFDVGYERGKVRNWGVQ